MSGCPVHRDNGTVRHFGDGRGLCKPGRMDEAVFYDLREVRALLFDLGGVVIDLDFGRAFRLWASRAGCDPRMIEERFVVDDAYELHERGEIQASEYFASLRQNIGIDLSDSDFTEGWNDIYLGAIPGMVEVLSIAQRHLPLFAFTNSNPTHQSVWEVRYANELKSFHTIFVSSDLGFRKPDPESFHLVSERIGSRPSEILFFDDGPTNVEGARLAGMQSVLVSSIDDVRRELAQLGLDVEL